MPNSLTRYVPPPPPLPSFLYGLYTDGLSDPRFGSASFSLQAIEEGVRLYFNTLRSDMGL